MTVINVAADMKKLSDKTCTVREDPTTIYAPIECECNFKGAGLYEFEGRSSVEKLTMDRLPQGTGLHTVEVAEGSCGSYLVTPKITVHHLPFKPSQPDSSSTEPNQYISVETTIDEITKPTPSKPSNSRIEETTITQSNSTVQPISTLVAVRIMPVRRAKDEILRMYIIIFIHQLYNRPLNQPLPPPHGHVIPQLQPAHFQPIQQPVLQPVP
ncbi:unnamed protein product [Mytilus coruscus]|uniref:Uncharacterized protein n=1 Tax=Mytilus coruscus TaxID=42192 RepID=A0A6J8CYK1_MYTCO|nr:unnamed protein product [Mytilus coruscus]